MNRTWRSPIESRASARCRSSRSVSSAGGDGAMTEGIRMVENHLVRLTLRHWLATIERNHGLACDRSRSERMPRHALVMASCVASSASARLPSIEYARRSPGSTSGPIRASKSSSPTPLELTARTTSIKTPQTDRRLRVQLKSLRPLVTNWSRRGPVPTSSTCAPISSLIRTT